MSIRSPREYNENPIDNQPNFPPVITIEPPYQTYETVPRMIRINPQTGQPITPTTPTTQTPTLPQILTTILTTANNTNMGNNNTADCACLIGTPFLHADGSCGCTSGLPQTVTPTVPAVPTKPIFTGGGGTTPIITTTPVIDIAEKVKNNPLLFIGAGVVLYLILKK